MPDNERRIIYRAIADFGNLATEAAKARREIQALKDAEGKSHSSSLQGVSALEAAHKRKTAAIKEESNEESRARQSTAQHTAAMLADAKALEQRAVAAEHAEKAARSERSVSSTGAGSVAEIEKRTKARTAETKAVDESTAAQTRRARVLATAAQQADRSFTGDLPRSGQLRPEFRTFQGDLPRRGSLGPEFQTFQGDLPRVGSLPTRGPGVTGQQLKLKIPSELELPNETDLHKIVDKLAGQVSSYMEGDLKGQSGAKVRSGMQGLLSDLFGKQDFSARLKGADAAAKAEEESTAKVARAQDTLQTAFHRSEGSVLRIQDAINNLSRVQNKFGAESSQAADATLRLARAHQTATRAAENYETATRNFEAAQKEAGRAVKDAIADVNKSENAGERLKTSLSSLGAATKNTFRDMKAGAHDAVGGLEEGASIFERAVSAIVGAASGVKGASDEFSGVGAIAKTGFNVASDAATSFAGMLLRVFPMIATLAVSLGPLVAILGAVGSAALGVAGALGSLAGSVAAVPGLLAAAVAGFGALYLAISPVIGVFKDYAAVAQASQQAAFNPQTAQEQIQKQQALQQAVWGVQAATQAQSNASYQLGNAYQAVTSAQTSLNEAVVTARRSLEDLEEQVRNAALAQRGASLNLAQAELEYRKALADPTKTLLDREEALQRVQEAQVSLSDTNKQAQRNQEDLSVAQRKGVMGSDQVVAAQQALQNALHGVVTAQQAVVQAQQGAVRAQWALADAQAKAIQPASAVATAQSKLAADMAKLSPSAQAVVKAFGGFSGVMSTLSKSVQESFFSKIVGQIDNLKSLIPSVTTLFTQAGSALGDVTAKGIAMVTSGPWKADFATGAAANAVVIRNLGNAALSVVDALHNIAIAAIPFTTWLTKGIANAADEFDRWSAQERSSGGIATFLKNLEPRLKTVGDIFKNIFSVVFNLGKAAMPFNDSLLKSIDAITKGWADTARAQTEAGSKFKKFLDDSKPILHELGISVKLVAQEFGHLAGDPNSQTGALTFLRALNEVWLPKIFGWLNDINKTGTFSALANSVSLVFKAIDAFWKEGGGGFITGLLGVFTALLTIITKLGFLAPALGAIGVALGGLAVLKFTGIFKLIRGIAYLSKIAKAGSILGIFKGLGQDLLAKIGIGKGSGTAGTADTASTTLAESGAKAGTSLTTAADEFKAIVVAAADQVKTILMGGATTAATELETGGLKTATELETGGAVSGEEQAVGGGLLGRFFGKGKGAAAGAEAAAGAKGASGGLLAGAAGPLTIGGMLLGQLGGSLSPGGKYGGAQTGVRAGGAILTGAGLGAGLGSIIPGLGTAIGAVIGAASGAIYSVIKDPNIRSAISDLGKSAGGFFASVGAWFRDKSRNVGNFAGNVLSSILGFFDSVGRNIRSWPGHVGQLVQTVRDNISGFFSDVGRNIRSWPGRIGQLVQNVRDSFSGFFSDVGRNIRSWPGHIGQLVQNVRDSITGFFSDLWRNIKKWPKAVWDWLTSVLPAPIRHFLGNPNAKGGSLAEGLSTVGEVGPEWAVKKGNQVQIIPMDVMSAQVARQSALASGVVPAFAMGTDFGAGRQSIGLAPVSAIGHQSSDFMETRQSVQGTESKGNFTIGKIEINNPKPEPAGDSLYRGVQKIKYFSGRE